MKMNFKNSFIKQNNFEGNDSTIPEIVKKMYDKKISSKGFQYEEKEGVLFIRLDGKKMGGLHFILDDEDKKILGDNYTPKDIMDYLENSAKVVKVAGDEKGKVILDGEEINLKDIFFNPYIKKENSEMVTQVIWDKKEHIKIHIIFDNEKKEVKLFRKPHKSIRNRLFEGCVFDVFKIGCLVLDDKVVFNVKIDASGKTNVNNLIRSFKLLRSFVSGDVKIEEVVIDKNNFNKDEIIRYDKRIEFLEEISLLEKNLKVNFEMSFVECFENKNVIIVNVLYRSFILKKASYLQRNLKSYNFKFNNNLNGLKDGYRVNLRFIDNETIKLFDEEIDLSKIVVLLNCKITVLRETKSESEILVENKNENMNLEIVGRYFKNENETDKYLENNEKVSNEFLRQAKEK